MAQKPLVVGDVYLLGGEARLKISVSSGGVPVTGITPTVTIVRDSDNFVADFVATVFDSATPATIGDSRFRKSMTELGIGIYIADFDPVPFGDNTEEVYTAIYRHDVPPNLFLEQDEFTFSNTLAGKVSTGFGFPQQCCNICKNVPTTLSYQALPGQTDVKITIYDPNNNLLVANGTMQELDGSGSTGIYQFEFTGTQDGQHTVIASEESNGSTDAMIITVGGDADRLKRIEQLLLALNLNPPSVGPCQ
jgi:hypothetical protein